MEKRKKKKKVRDIWVELCLVQSENKQQKRSNKI